MDSIGRVEVVDTVSRSGRDDPGHRKPLQVVTVTGKRQMIRQEADRIIYDIQADPQSKISSVLDMMRKVPYLSVDGDDNVLLNGSTGYKVFINGRPSGLVERNPKDVLRSMPASTIKSIEVITNPPAKYDAEGLAGIINIVTDNRRIYGYRGSVNINGKAPVGGPGVGLSFSARHGKLALNVISGGALRSTPQTSDLLTRNTSQPNASVLEQITPGKNDSKAAYTGMELSYEPDSLNLLVVQVNVNNNRFAGVSDQRSEMKTPSGLLKRYRLLTNTGNAGVGMDASFNYQRSFHKSGNHMFAFSYRYMENGDDYNIEQHTGEAINFSTQGYRQYNIEKLGEHTVQADYTRPINKLIVECGLKRIFRSNSSCFRSDDLNTVTGIYETDSLRSDRFSSRQNILSIYQSYDYRIGSWQVKGGIRLEQTFVSGDFISGTTPVNQEYLNLFPSVAVSKKFGKGNSLNLSYTRRIQRPAIAQLNPFVDLSNPEFRATGNPNLRPTISSVTRLSYFRSGKATYHLSIGYKFSDRLIGRIYRYDMLNNATVSRYENQSKVQIMMANIYINYPAGKNINLTMNADLRSVFVYSFIGDTVFKNFRSMAYVNLSGNYSFGKGWRAMFEFTAHTGDILGSQGRSNGFMATTFGLNKDIIKKKLTISAAVDNPVTRFRYEKNTIWGTDFTQYTSDQKFYRRFVLTLNYRFGKLKGETKKSIKGIDNDDLAK